MGQAGQSVALVQHACPGQGCVFTSAPASYTQGLDAHSPQPLHCCTVLMSKYDHRPIEPAGPYGFIFASFVQYFFDFPSTSHFGWKFSNKVGERGGPGE